MFKKGQLVRHIKHGWVLLVVRDEVPGRQVQLGSPIRLAPFKAHAHLLKLVGNNYRAKQKCSR